jgi:peptidoglycan hydrolase-like protein with peptidoglycan-binding domain
VVSVLNPGPGDRGHPALLQQMGYYTGEVDGLLGPLTRQALAAYQPITGSPRQSQSTSRRSLLSDWRKTTI